MRSLRDIGYADWFTLIEPLVVYDPILQQDPANATSLWISTAARPTASGWRRLPATPIAPSRKWRRRRSTLALESKEKHRVEDPRLRARRAHVGYYLIDRGFPMLASRVGYRPRFIDRLRQIDLEQRG